MQAQLPAQLPSQIPSQIPTQSQENLQKSTLLHQIDYNNAENKKLIEQTLQEAETTSTQDQLMNQTQQLQQHLMHSQENMQQGMPQGMPQNMPQTQLQTQPQTQPQPQPKPQEKMISHSGIPPTNPETFTGKVHALLPSIEKYQLKYPSFLFQEVNVKKLVILVILCIIFQLPGVRNAMFSGTQRITQNEWIPCIILGLLNAAIYITIIQCIESTSN